MDPNLYFVFSQKPDWVSRDDYHAWYVDHAQENIESPGFLSAQRYVTAEVQNGRAVGSEQHLCVYQYEGDMKTWRDSLSRSHQDRRHRAQGLALRHRLPQLDVRAGRRAAHAEDALRHRDGVIVERDDFASLVDPGAELTLLASGYVFTEGPVWSVGGAGAVLQRHPRRPALPVDASRRRRADHATRRSRATAWRSTSRGG